MDDTDIDARWYWDRRTNKAYYPTETDEGTVRFVTVWHAAEVADARDRGALVPVEAVGLDRTETTFDLLDSFRLPDDVESTVGSEDTGGAGASGDETGGGD